MNRISHGAFVGLFVMSCSVSVKAEPMTLEGTITDVIGHRLVVANDKGKTLVQLGPKAAGQTALKVGDKVKIDGDMKKDDELKAEMVTLADGKVYEIKKKKSWMEWMTGKTAADAGPFSADAAKKLAVGKGYTLTSEPVSKKKHFVAAATKDGKAVEINIHADGNIDEAALFGATEAKKLASDKGYTLTSEPVAEKKHFTATGTKAGKTYELDMHRNGSVEERVSYTPVEARKSAVDNGYEVVGEPKKEKNHYALLGKKEGKFYELHAHNNGSVKTMRPVDKTDLKWGPMIQ